MLRQYEYSKRGSEILFSHRASYNTGTNTMLEALPYLNVQETTNLPGYLLSVRNVFSRIKYIKLLSVTVVYLEHRNLGNGKNHIDE